MIEFNATFIVAMLSFVVFIFIMNAIFYKPVLNIMRKREEYITGNYSEAKENSEKAQHFDSERAEQIQKTQETCRVKIKDAVEKAQNEASKVTQSAREEVKSQIQAQKDSLYKAGKELEDNVKKNVVSDLANSITSKLIGNSLITNKQ